MKTFETADEVIDFAIAGEEESCEFYTGLAERMKKQEMEQVFLQFAQEEQAHKAKLQEVKKGNIELSPSSQKITDLKIGDYLVDVKPSPDMDYQKALILAMKKEKAAFRLYNDLADTVSDEKLKEVFKGLAQEEAKHKLRFEIEYDDDILEEN